VSTKNRAGKTRFWAPNPSRIFDAAKPAHNRGAVIRKARVFSAGWASQILSAFQAWANTPCQGQALAIDTVTRRAVQRTQAPILSSRKRMVFT